MLSKNAKPHCAIFYLSILIFLTSFSSSIQAGTSVVLDASDVDGYANELRLKSKACYTKAKNNFKGKENRKKRIAFTKECRAKHLGSGIKTEKRDKRS